MSYKYEQPRKRPAYKMYHPTKSSKPIAKTSGRKYRREEYVGDGDRAIRIPGRDFPLIFMTNRFSDFGWDLYKVENAKDYQDYLFNDEFMAVGSKHKPVASAKNLAEARKLAKEMLAKP